MKYYKTPEDKAAGKPAARALYHDKKNVEVECADDKGPDYEFIDALVRKAALDGQPGIKFGEEMTPEFANKLAAACVKYGMKMKGQPEMLLTVLRKQMSANIKILQNKPHGWLLIKKPELRPKAAKLFTVCMTTNYAICLKLRKRN